MALMRFRGEDGQIHEMTVIRGNKGKDGADGRDGLNAPQIDDTQITPSNPWSSEKIIDTLCPPFEESGNPVQCTPVAGYPLSVKATVEPVQHFDWMSKAGTSSQVTTTGAQMFDPTTAISTASYIASALPTGLRMKAWGSSIIGHGWVVEHLKPSTVYYVRCRIKKTAEPGADYTAHGLDKRLLLYSPNGGGSVSLVNWNTACAVGESKDFAVSFTTPAGVLDETLNYSIYGYSEYYTKEGAQASAATIEITDLIISETDVAFEPYTGGAPSPSPEYPQAITDSIPAGNYYVPSTAPEGGYWKIVLDEALGSVNSYQDRLEIDSYTGRYRLIRKTRKTVLTGGMLFSNASTDAKYSVFGAIPGTDHKDFTPIMTDLMQGCEWSGTTTPVWTYWNAVGSNGIMFPVDVVSSVDEANAWLSEHPLTVRYVMTNPITMTGQAVLVTGTSGSTALSVTSMEQTAPDPDHPCQISVQKSVEVARCGKNILGDPYVVGANAYWGYSEYGQKPFPPGSYTFSTNIAASGIYATYVDENTHFTAAYNKTLFSFTADKPFCLMCYKDGGIAEGMMWQLELGSTATPHEPYVGDGYTITLPEGFAGGEIDVTGEEALEIWSHIADYAGEEIGNEWLSDIGELTMGADVWYKMSIPIEHAIAQQPIPALPGINTLTTDAQSLTVTGRADPVATVTALEDRVAALESAAATN